MLMETLSASSVRTGLWYLGLSLIPTAANSSSSSFVRLSKNTKPKKKKKFLKFQCVDSRKQKAEMVSADQADILYLEAQKTVWCPILLPTTNRVQTDTFLFALIRYRPHVISVFVFFEFAKTVS